MASATSGFKIPACLDEQGRVTPLGSAVKGQVYRCPDCGSRIALRGGEGLRTALHFYHTAGGTCSLETILHKAAKLKVREVVQDWLDGRGRPPAYLIHCHGRDTADCDWIFRFTLDRREIDEVRLEKDVDEVRPDLTLYRQGQPVLAIEVLVTHAVDEAKAAKLMKPWIELRAEAILESPPIWRPVNFRLNHKLLCRCCDEIDFKALAAALDSIRALGENWIVTSARNREAARATIFTGDGWIGRAIQAEIRRYREFGLAMYRWRAAPAEDPPKPPGPPPRPPGPPPTPHSWRPVRVGPCPIKAEPYPDWMQERLNKGE